MKKALSFLLALVMVLSVLPFGMFAAQEVSAAAPETAKVTLTVAPVSPHLEKVKETGDYVLRAKLLLSTDKAFTLGSLEFHATPAAGVTVSYESAGAQRALSMGAEMAGENPTGKVLFTWLFDKATADAPSTELAMSADTSYDLGTIVLTGGETLRFQDANLEGVLAGLFDSDETNGTTYDLEVVYARDEYTRSGHNDDSITWIPLDAAAAAALECDKYGDTIVDNGHYYLTEDVFIKAGEQTGFKNKTFTICLNGHNLKGTGTARLFRIESGVNMTICDCQKKGTISNPKADGKGYGGADGNLIGLVSGASTVTLQDVKLDGLNMADGTSSYGGGALYVVGAGSVLTMDDCQISGFAHKHGGAIMLKAKAELNLTNVIFTDNTATTYDGAIYCEFGTANITNCTFTNNHCAGAGPAVMHLAESGTMRLHNCTITGNSRTSTTSKAYSGAVQVRGTTSCLYVSGTTVIRNNKDIDGAERNLTFCRAFSTTNKKNALFVDGLTEGSHISIDTFDDTSGTMAFFTREDANTLVIATDKQTDWNSNWLSYDQKAGAHIGRTDTGFTYLAHSHADMADATWTAWGDDAAERTTLPTETGNYYLVSDINMTQKAYFKTTSENENVVVCLNNHNVRGVSGNATAGENRMWHINAGRVTVCDCTATRDAEGNLMAGTLYPGAGVDGCLAGLFINGNAPQTLEFTMKDVIVDGENISRANTAIAVSYYGTIAPATGKVTVANISGCEFKNYTTTSANGMIHVLPNNKLNVTDTKFVNNTAKRGAAIASFAGIVDLENCAFVNNASTGTGSTQYPEFYGGGAIYSGQGSYTVSDKTTYVNTPSLTVEDCSFVGNSAVTSGGAIYTYYGSATITGSTFDNNTANGYNGGAILNNQTTFNISDSTFTDNVANYQGGALFLNYGTTTIENTTFTGNEAKATGAASKYAGGGAIYTVGKLTATDCDFNENTSVRNGAAIYSSYTNTTAGMNLTRCEFTKNVADVESIVFITKQSINTMTDCVFTGNVSNDVGASAVNNEGSSTVILDGCTITGNTANATGEAGATYTSGTSALVLKGDTVIRDNFQSNGTERNVIIKAASSTGKATGRGLLNVNGLSAGAAVKVFTSTSDVRATADKLVQVYPTNGAQTSWDKSWITYENTGKAVDRVDGVFVFAETPVAVVNGQSFDAVDTALAQAATNNGTVKLLAEVNSTVTVPAGAQIQLDLNNEKLGANAKFTSTGAATLLLADSTKSYDDAEPVKVAKSAIGANVDVADAYKVGNSRYVAVENGDFYEVHRVQAASVAKTLRTATNGIGFKVKFAAQKSLTDDVTGFGVKFQVKQGDSVVGERTVDLTKDYDKTMVNGQELVIVINEILVENGKDNAVNAGYTIEGTPFIKIGDGTVVANGLTLSASYKDMVEYAAGDAFWATATNAQKAGLAKMYGQFGSIMTNWNIQNIVNYYNNPTQQ